MDLGDYLQLVHDRFSDDSFQLVQDIISDIEVTIATMQEFRLSWLASKMHYFGVYGLYEEITQPVIERFSLDSFEYAKHNYTGLPRGFQKGFASLSMLASLNVSLEAKNWVEKYSKKHFAAFELPVIVDLSKSEIIYRKKKPLWGRMYYNTFHHFIEKYYAPRN